MLWLFLTLILIGITWVVTSDNPWAQEMQELAGKKHDQSILETEAPFSIAAHSFRFYKFDLPEGSAHISVVGQFAAAPDTRGSKISNDPAKDAPVDSSIEVYVLTEPAFAVWEKGYAASSVYESGKVQQATVRGQSAKICGCGCLLSCFQQQSRHQNGQEGDRYDSSALQQLGTKLVPAIEVDRGQRRKGVCRRVR